MAAVRRQGNAHGPPRSPMSAPQRAGPTRSGGRQRLDAGGQKGRPYRARVESISRISTFETQRHAGHDEGPRGLIQLCGEIIVRTARPISAILRDVGQAIGQRIDHHGTSVTCLKNKAENPARMSALRGTAGRCLLACGPGSASGSGYRPQPVQLEQVRAPCEAGRCRIPVVDWKSTRSRCPATTFPQGALQVTASSIVAGDGRHRGAGQPPCRPGPPSR